MNTASAGTGAPNAIDVRGLVKRYDDHLAVDGVDLSVEQGEIFAFLGPNGAGKTTTIEILEGYRERDSGEVSVLGEDPATASREWRERLGIVLQESEIEAELTAREAVTMHAAYFADHLDPDNVLELVGLASHADHRAKKMSGGQKRRLDLALALVGNPDLVFLDEPTTGFDPGARRESWGMIENLRDLGRTVLLTTHYMDEAEHLADRIAVIAAGEIVARGTAAELAAQVNALPVISWRSSSLDGLPGGLPAVEVTDGLASLETDDVVGTVHALTSWSRDDGPPLDELQIVQPTLEDVYLRLVGSVEADSASGDHGGATT